MRQRTELGSGWYILNHEDDILIGGPGQLEINLGHFNSTLVNRTGKLPQQVFGNLLQRSWEYPLKSGLTIHLVSTWDPRDEVASFNHTLHVGNTVTWQVPPSVALILHNLGR